MREVRTIGTKIWHVLNPLAKNQNILRDWDWWGPLLLCLILSVRLSSSSPNPSLVFSSVFFIVWFGSAIVTVNSKLLGGKVSFFQSVCILGYCVFPLVVASMVALFVPYIVSFITTLVAYAWTTFASLNFLQDSSLDNKRLLALYPIFLFYFMITWLVFLDNQDPNQLTTVLATRSILSGNNIHPHYFSLQFELHLNFPPFVQTLPTAMMC
jgi:hypothetical protein